MRDFPSLAPRFASTLALAALASLAGACGPGGQQSTLCLFRDTINKPESRSQRRAIMAKGLSNFCDQMKAHNAPLRLAPDAPVIGRYYPTDCRQKDLENGDLCDGTYVCSSGHCTIDPATVHPKARRCPQISRGQRSQRNPTGKPIKIASQIRYVPWPNKLSSPCEGERVNLRFPSPPHPLMLTG